MSEHQSLDIRTHGIILETENFDACVHFYRDIVGLPVWYEKDQLVCLRFGDGYLMVETGGKASRHLKLNTENPITLRFNVDDVEGAGAMLQNRGVQVQFVKYDWGTVGIFADPDGNKCELKNADDPFFN